MLLLCNILMLLLLPCNHVANRIVSSARHLYSDSPDEHSEGHSASTESPKRGTRRLA